MLSNYLSLKARVARDLINKKSNYKELKNVIEEISKNSFTMTRSGKTLLHEAIACNNVEAIEMLLQYGHPLLFTNEIGYSVLHYAVVHGEVSCVEKLLSYGHPVDATGDDGNTPLHLAFLSLKIENIFCLIIHGANLNKRNRFCEKPVDMLEYAFLIDFKKAKEIENFFLK